MDIKWGKVKLGDVAKFISTNTLSRDFLSDNEGEILDIHYGDVLIKYDSIVDTENESIPRILPSVDKTFSNYAKCGDIIMADITKQLGKI